MSAEALRVNRFLPLEEGEKRLLLVVENAAFAEADDASWTLAQLLQDGSERTRADLLKDLTASMSEEEAKEAIRGFEQLEILIPKDRPSLPVDLQLPQEPISSLVLHVSHDCNMRCGYCYSDFGRYGEDRGQMTPELAVEYVEFFFDQLPQAEPRLPRSDRTHPLHITFFGGEPLLNLETVYAAHAYAKERALREGRNLAFGITTNGTLLTDEVVRFFERERFSVTVSIDGPPEVNDAVRLMQDGGKSYDLILSRLKMTGLNAVARVTLSKQCVDIARIVRHLIGVGFVEVGVSPAATGRAHFDLDREDLEEMLAGLDLLAEDFVAAAQENRLYPFSNLRMVLEQIAIGTPRPVPCGAGTRLVAADNKGDLYACHRLVGQESFRIGHRGIDAARRFEVLKQLHPRHREPCDACWARYLCGGGCHHLAWLHSDAQDPWTLDNDFCDFLRGWYRLALKTYVRIADEAPETLERLVKAPLSCLEPTGL